MCGVLFETYYVSITEETFFSNTEPSASELLENIEMFQKIPSESTVSEGLIYHNNIEL